MSTVRSLMSVLSVVALLVGSVSGAHAGGAMGLGDDGSSACRAISNGANPPHVAHWTSNIDDRTGVKLGPATLLCDLGIVGGANVAQNPSFNQDLVNSFVCYAISGGGQQKLTVTISDKLIDQTVSLAPDKFLCVPAVFNFAQ